MTRFNIKILRVEFYTPAEESRSYTLGKDRFSSAKAAPADAAHIRRRTARFNLRVQYGGERARGLLYCATEPPSLGLRSRSRICRGRALLGRPGQARPGGVGVKIPSKGLAWCAGHGWTGRTDGPVIVLGV